MKRKLPFVLLLLAVLVALAFFTVAPTVAEWLFNGTRVRGPYHASERGRALHATLLVADMHADTLLWDRDVLARSARGHVDVPRLAEGGVALQFFTVVSKTPYAANYDSNPEGLDGVTAIAFAERWPLRALRSLRERALYQARKLNEAATRSGGRFTVIRTADDLARFVERRKSDPQLVAGLLGLEGAYPLEGDVAGVDALFDAGFRMMAPTHFYDNEWGGSAHGVNKTGLTDKGREMVRRMEARGMLVDLAHASAATITDVVAVSTRPLVVSHTGVRGTCDNNRNLSDEQLRKIATKGGVVGIGYWDAATCGLDAHAVARAIRHAANVIGVEHVALGSDFDGAVTEPFDTTGVVLVTDALLEEGFNEEEVSAIMGGNVFRLLAETLPR
ncbi:MAG: rane dipeptidase [Acidobacteriota bacterium]|jgi:microsomal dipeptidase-like Zn-dependent dipeptidase|nr:rane dipeptidase [Acidobacteriota bacterium]